MMRSPLLYKAFLLSPVVALGLLLLGPALSGEVSSTAEEDACPPYEPNLSRERYLRSLSLDLRGKLPTPQEQEEIQVQSDVPESLIDQWLASPEFASRVTRLHRELLWNNVSNVTLNSASITMGTSGGMYYRRQLALMYRGVAVPCNDEPAQFTPDGQLVTRKMEDGSNREGYVLVKPYWAPTTTLKVCGFDAQTAAISRTGTDCSTRDALDDPGCGCGPELQWCSLKSTEVTILQAMAEDVDRRVTQLVLEDRPYLDLFEGHDAYVNGPLVHFWRHLPEFFGTVKYTPISFDRDDLPELKFDDKTTWVKMTMPDAHAGILTSPGYLTRFQTNRARANRFFNAFLCQPFQPPEGGIPSTGDSFPTLDLQVRDGCKYCHTLLEPSASYWGRWSEQGGGYLDPQNYTPSRDDCERCALTGQGCTDQCRRQYIIKALTEEEEPWLGMFKPYEFRHEEHIDHIEQGPRMLAQLGVQDGRIPDCVTRTAFHWLMGRDPLTEEEAWIDELSYEFVASGYRYRSLVKSIVTSPNYRRVE